MRSFLLTTYDEKIDITITHGRDKCRRDDELGQATAIFGQVNLTSNFKSIGFLTFTGDNQNSYTSLFNQRDFMLNPTSFRDCKVDGETFSAHLHRER